MQAPYDPHNPNSSKWIKDLQPVGTVANGNRETKLMRAHNGDYVMYATENGEIAEYSTPTIYGLVEHHFNPETGKYDMPSEHDTPQYKRQVVVGIDPDAWHTPAPYGLTVTKDNIVHGKEQCDVGYSSWVARNKDRNPIDYTGEEFRDKHHSIIYNPKLYQGKINIEHHQQ